MGNLAVRNWGIYFLNVPEDRKRSLLTIYVRISQGNKISGMELDELLAWDRAGIRVRRRSSVRMQITTW
jgi:hypothetical protein